MNLLFIHWKMAFDKVDHSALLIALQKFEKYISIIGCFYTAPRSCVSSVTGEVLWGEASTGIGQGCPLSRYFVVIPITVLFSDVDKRILTTGIPTYTWSVGKPVYDLDLEYADDTSLMGITSRQTQELLRAGQVKATLYNMHLNLATTELLTHPESEDGPILFVDCTPNGDKVPGYSSNLGTYYQESYSVKAATFSPRLHEITAFVAEQNMFTGKGLLVSFLHCSIPALRFRFSYLIR